MTGLRPGGKYACFECGCTSRFRGDSPSYLEGQSKFKADHQGRKKGGEGNPTGKEVRKKENAKEKVKILAYVEDFPKFEIVIREMRRFPRNRRQLFQKK